MFQINKNPKAGVCRVYPSEGIAAETEFYWECTTPFEPSVLPDKYEVLTRFKSTNEWSLAARMTSEIFSVNVKRNCGPL